MRRRRRRDGPAFPWLRPGGILCHLRGRYGPPEPIGAHTRLWRGDIRPLLATPGAGLRCEGEAHRDLRCYFPHEEMWAQRWVLTDEERREAEYAYDVLSLEGWPPRVVCQTCAAQVAQGASP